MRIVSLCPSNTEILACLGLENQLIGVDRYSDWPSSVRSLPNLGPDLNIDMDKVVELQPDLIVASLSVPGMERIVSRLNDISIPYLVLNPKRLTDIYDDILQVGEATGKKTEALQLVSRMKARIEEIAARCQESSHRPRLYWEWWPKPVFSPGGGNWLTDVSEVVSAVNIFADRREASVKTDWQTVAEAAPDYALMVWTGVAKEKVPLKRIIERPEWQGMPFLDKGRLHILDEGWYCRPSPRLLTGIEHLAHLLYPDTFSEAKSVLI